MRLTFNDTEKLTCDNPRITEIEYEAKFERLTYFIDGKLTETFGEPCWIMNRDKQFIGIQDEAVVRDPEDDDIILEEIPFEAYFID